MSLEQKKILQNYIENKKYLVSAEVISLEKNKNFNKSKDLSLNAIDHWNISHETNEDQYKAITGICFMFGALLVMGLYSNLF
tara:strand:+ start:1564 stop:1809 length:246 start_codon:yes stop_codon:yes gene_type:complete